MRNAACLADASQEMWGLFVCHELFAFPRKNLASTSLEVSCVLRMAPVTGRYCWVLCGESSSLPKASSLLCQESLQGPCRGHQARFGKAFFRLCQCGVATEEASCKEIKLGTAKWRFLEFQQSSSTRPLISQFCLAFASLLQAKCVQGTRCARACISWQG